VKLLSLFVKSENTEAHKETHSHTQEETFTDAFTIADKKVQPAQTYLKYKNTHSSQ